MSNLSNTTPAAPSGGVNITWQNDSSSPPNVSGYISSVPTGGGAIKNAQFPSGVNNFSVAAQSQVVVANTAYYITNSNLAVPNPFVNGIVVGTSFNWHVHMSKSAAGTGVFDFIIYMGTNGSSSDTAEVTQAISAGNGSAAVDDLVADVLVVFTAVGNGSASFYWSMAFKQNAATGTGFGLTNTAITLFNGTVSSLNSTTAGLIFGLGFNNVTGTPTISVPFVAANAYNLD